MIHWHALFLTLAVFSGVFTLGVGFAYADNGGLRHWWATIPFVLCAVFSALAAGIGA